MLLVYLDESARGKESYFFGALLANADAVRSIEEGMNGVARLISHNVAEFSPRTEFHAVNMFHGKEEWETVPIPWRVKACDLSSKVLARSGAKFIFRGVDISAQCARYGKKAYPAHLMTLAHTLQDVDEKMTRLDKDDRLGLAVADEHHAAIGARRNLRDFKIQRVPGYTNKVLTHIADTMYFGPSHESRLLQAADIATYFINRTRTIQEKDPRSFKAVQKIARRIRSITISEYVWVP